VLTVLFFVMLLKAITMPAILKISGDFCAVSASNLAGKNELCRLLPGNKFRPRSGKSESELPARKELLAPVFLSANLALEVEAGAKSLRRKTRHPQDK
jgi:hypothetical protein